MNATEPQMNMIRRLAPERGFEDWQQAAHDLIGISEAAETIDRYEAGDLIQFLLAIDPKPGFEPPATKKQLIMLKRVMSRTGFETLGSAAEQCLGTRYEPPLKRSQVTEVLEYLKSVKMDNRYFIDKKPKF